MGYTARLAGPLKIGWAGSMGPRFSGSVAAVLWVGDVPYVWVGHNKKLFKWATRAAADLFHWGLGIYSLV